MRFLVFLQLTVVLLQSGSLFSQTNIDQTTDQLFKNRGEIYFSFLSEDREEINAFSRILSIDHIKNDQVFAYANRKEFTEFMKYGISFELLPKPGESLKNPRMMDYVDIKGINEWDFYPTYQAYLDMMNQFASQYPSLCQIVNIGTSQEGRQILMARISDNVATKEAEPQFLYTSSIHGDELTGYILTLRLINYLLSNYGTDPKVTNLVNNLEIWINPLSNPDGTYAGGNNTVYGATRYNANNVDVNRNYPDPEDGPHPDGNAWQPETIVFMDFAEENDFVFSGNFHGGAEVINYPWDTWPRFHADNSWWNFVSRQYADTVHLHAPSGYLTDLDNGVTNGYAWYTISGGRQDYMTYFHYGRESTMEISETKTPSANQLPNFWNYNYRSLLNYMEQATYGITGTVTDSVTHAPLVAKVEIVGHDLDNSYVYSTIPFGKYFRPIFTGTYSLTFTAPGHMPKTINNVSISNYNTVVVDVELSSGTLTAGFDAFPTSVQIGGTVDFADQSYGSPVSWLWTFEGGNPSTSDLQYPLNITYAFEGTYDVTLTVTNSQGQSSTLTKPDYISVNAEFLMENNTITTCNGLFYDSGGNTGNYNDDEDLTFTIQPAGAGSKVKIEFQLFDVEYQSSCTYDWLKIYQGTTATGTPIGTYCGTNSPGIITSTHTSGALTFVFHSDYSVNKPGWKALISCTSPPVPPTADFSGNPVSVYANQTVQFTDNSTGAPTSWVWTFEGGNPANSNLQNPVISYNQPGTYDVSLQAINQYGSNTVTKQDYITCLPALLPPVAEFSASSTDIFAGESVVFTDQSQGNPTNWLWLFPGGIPSSSTVQNPVIQYPSVGDYDVVLIALNPAGSDTLTREGFIHVDSAIGISEPDQSKLTIYPNPVNEDLLTIKADQEILQVDVLSGTGNVLKSYQGGGRQISILTDKLPAGLYFLRTNISGKIRYSKIVINQ